ncbi:MAG TPA: hypothetical protein VFQ45_17850 [Longimicrobium sp.]|nr:hypothetical protein [Longimicrobium sp.]
MPDPFLSDLALTRRATNALTSDREAVDLRAARGDLLRASGRDNLAQAILNRLYTRVGALSGLGHPAYGSRLYLLAGEPDTRRTRALAEFYVREALGRDPRVTAVDQVLFETSPRNSPLRNALRMHVTVVPAGGEAPLTVTLTPALGG